MREEIIYLACPYTWAPEVSYNICCREAAKLMEDGHVVFAPVVHSHPICDHLPEERKLDFDFWMKQDLPILRRCTRMIVLVPPIDDVLNKSKGVKRELEVAREMQIPITFQHTRLP